MNYSATKLPLKIYLGRATAENSLVCKKILRHLPGKRLVCAGVWQQRPVLVKLFLDPRHAQRHWSRENSGLELLNSAGISTPDLLFSGQLDNGTPVLVFEFLEEAETALDLWNRLTSEKGKRALLNQLLDVIVALHDAELIQKDLHLENFLLSDQRLYAIDGDAVSSTGHGGAVAHAEVVSNLALFFAQLLPKDDVFLDASITYYARARDMNGEQLAADLKVVLPEVRRKRRQKYVKKCYRTCSEFVRSQANSQVSITRRDAQGETLDRLLNDPDDFMREGEILKDGNTCTVVRVQADACDWVIKRYNIKNPLHYLSRCLRQTRAWTSWGNAHHLKVSGIETPRAIAVLEKRFGPLRSTGYYVCDFQDGPLASHFFAPERVDSPGIEEVAENFVRLFELFKKLGIHHGDCKATNFLVVDGAPSVLDLDAMCMPESRQAFDRLFKIDRQRFLNNWQTSPELKDWFDRHLPH
jgi:tRNA A-37 threonylcarbamoyl transferase component Bud32